MDSAQALIAVVAVALALVAGGIAVQYSSGDVGKQYTVNETVETGAVGDTTTLDYSNTDGFSYSDRVTVVDQSGNKLFDGVDYEWNSRNGTLKPDSQNAANTNVTVTYSFAVPTQEQQNVTNVVAYILDSGAWIPLVLVVATIVLGVARFGGLRS